MRTTRTSTLALGSSTLALLGGLTPAQSLLSQYGEVVHAVGDAVPPAAFGVTPAPGATLITDPFGENLGNGPVLDQDGTILYRALFGGGATTSADNRAYFLGRAAGDLRMVVRAGDQAPGCPAGTLLRNSAGSNGLGSLPRISPRSGILFYSSNLWDPASPGSTPASADSALFWGQASGQLLLAREGDPVPFLGGGVLYGQLSLSAASCSINSFGSVLFAASVTGGTATAATDGVLVSGQPGSLAAVVREGDVLGTGEVVIPVTGTTNLSGICFLNEIGQVLHELRFSTTSGTATAANDRALAIWSPVSGRTIVAREGQPAPGLPAGVLFATPGNGWTPTPVGNCTFTNSGDTVLNAALDGGGTVPGVDDSALYYGGIGGWTLVLRKGDPCPGLAGVTFGTIGNNSLGCIDGGDLVFLSTLVGTGVTPANDTATWLRRQGTLQLLAREGDPVPGMAPSGNGPWQFGNMTAGPQTPNLNQRGYVLFENTISDGVATKNMWFGYVPALGIVRVLEDTDTFTTSVGTGTWNTISTASGSNHSGDVSPKWFDNNGDFVAKLFLNGAPQAAIVRGHLGSLIAEPSAVPVTGGVPQNFHIDCGTAQAGRFYLVLASGLGTQPGFVSPFGGQLVSLNPDPVWTTLSLDNPNSIVWPGTLGFLDAAGKGIGPASFLMPPGFPVFQGATLHHVVIAFDLTAGLTTYYASEPSAVYLY